MYAALAGDLEKHLEIVPFGRIRAGLTLPHRFGSCPEAYNN
jgi:hypothetical protein